MTRAAAMFAFMLNAAIVAWGLSAGGSVWLFVAGMAAMNCVHVAVCLLMEPQ